MDNRTLLEDVRDVWRAFTDLSESGDIDVNCYGEAAVLARKQLNSILARVEAALASDAPEQLEDAQEKIKQLTIDLLQQTAEASKNYELGLAAGFEKGLIAAEERQAALAEKKENTPMTDEQIKHMVDRFLQWKLPADFNPDGGVTFDPISSKGTPYERVREPVGTNLLSATQAEAMVRHMVEELPHP